MLDHEKRISWVNANDVHDSMSRPSQYYRGAKRASVKGNTSPEGSNAKHADRHAATVSDALVHMAPPKAGKSVIFGDTIAGLQPEAYIFIASGPAEAAHVSSMNALSEFGFLGTSGKTLSSGRSQCRSPVIVFS